MRVKWQAAAALAALTVVSGCTVAVGGSASPVPGQGPVAPPSACTLLDQGQLDALGYESPGRSVPGNKDRRQPPMCLWHSKDGDGPLAVLNVGMATDLDFNEYIAGAVPKSAPQRIGGLSWTQYASIVADDCTMYALLGDKSFAFVSVSGPPLDRSCELAKQVIPQVAAHLPGGQPAPPVTPTSSSAKPEPGGPLLSLDPCAMLKPDQVAQLKNIAPDGQKNTSTSVPDASYCLWPDTDGDQGQKPFEVWLGPSTPAAEWPGTKGVAPAETVDVNGRKWSVFPNLGGTRVACGATLPITDTSSVQVVSGFIGDDSKACDLVKQGLPLVTANLPG